MAECTVRAIRPLIKRQLFSFSFFKSGVFPSLTPASSCSNDDRSERAWTPDGDDLLKEQVKWKQDYTEQAPPHLDHPSSWLCILLSFFFFSPPGTHSYVTMAKRHEQRETFFSWKHWAQTHMHTHYAVCRNPAAPHRWQILTNMSLRWHSVKQWRLVWLTC